MNNGNNPNNRDLNNRNNLNWGNGLNSSNINNQSQGNRSDLNNPSQSNRRDLNRGNGLNNSNLNNQNYPNNPNNQNYLNNQNKLNNQNNLQQYGYGRIHTNSNQLPNENNSIRQLDEMYRRGMKAQRGSKRKKFFIATTLTAAAVTGIVVPIVIYRKNEDNRYEIIIESDVKDFESYRITISRGSTISDVKEQLNKLEGHTLIGVYQDEECTIEYEDTTKIRKDTTVYLKFEKERYSINIPDSQLYTINYSSGIDPDSIEWGERFIFWLDLDESCDPDSVEVYTSESSIPLQAGEYERYKIEHVTKDIDIIVNASIKMYNITIPEGVEVVDENDNIIEDNSKIEHGKKITVRYAEKEGYRTAEFKINGITKSNGVTIDGVTEDIVITYKEERIGYIVSLPSEMKGYSIEQTSNYTDLNNLSYGNAYVFKIKLDEAYNQSIPAVSVNGVKLTPDGEKYTISINKEQLYWEASEIFKIDVGDVNLNTYNVITEVDEGCTIDVKSTVQHGEEFTFTVTLDDAYSGKNPTVIVEGATLEATNERVDNTITYTVKDVDGMDSNSDNVIDAIKITVSGLTVNTYTITAPTASVAYNTTLSPVTTVTYGGTVEFTLTLKDGYTQTEPTFNECPATITLDESKTDRSNHTYVYIISNVTGNVDLVVNVPKNKYQVVFKNYDGTQLYVAEVEHGNLAEYSGEAPTRPSTNEYQYTFTGWDKDLTTQITSDTIFIAQFDEERIEYGLTYIIGTGCDAVVVKDSLGNQLDTNSTLYYGDEITITCIVADSHQYVELFEIEGLTNIDGNKYQVTGNVSFTARGVGENQYVVTLPTGTGYTASFTEAGEDGVVNYGDEISFKIELNEGYNGSNSTVKANGNILTGSNGIYTLYGVAEDVAVTVEGVVINAYTVTFVDEDGTVLQSGQVNHGAHAEYTGETPIKDSDNALAYTWEFIGWGGDLSQQPITMDTTFTAHYEQDWIEYELNYDSADRTVILTVERDGEELANGETIYYGDELTINIRLANNYASATVNINGTTYELSDNDNHEYRITVEGDTEISVDDAEKTTFTIEYSSGEAYMLTGPTVAEYGSEIQFTFKFADDAVSNGYYIDPNNPVQIIVSVIGLTSVVEEYTAIDFDEHSFTIENVISDVQISIENIQHRESYTIDYEQQANSTITVTNQGGSGGTAPSGMAYYGDKIEIVITADSGYEISNVSVSGATDNGDGTYTVTGNVTISYVVEAINRFNFTLIDNGTAYSVSAINKSISGDVIIPAEYNGKPVTTIAANGFKDCTSITSVTLPESITTIENMSFWGCGSLTGNLYIPAAVTSIGTYLTGGCSNLTSLVVDEDNEYYTSRDSTGNECNIVIEIATNKLIAGCQNSTIPNGVTEIGLGAFNRLSTLTEIEIPETVTIIGAAAFQLCTALTSINIPSSVNSIGLVAFGSTSLASATFGDTNGWEVKYMAYSDNPPDDEYLLATDLSNETVAATYLKSTYANYGWTKTENTVSLTLNVDGAAKSAWAESGAKLEDAMNACGYTNENTCGFFADDTFTIGYADDATITEGMIIYTKTVDEAMLAKLSFVKVGATAYSAKANNTSIEGEVVIPKEYNGLPVTAIAENGFKGCKNITSVILPYGITTLSSGYIFYSCSYLTNITIPTSVTSIGAYAFAYCGRLTEITIPNSVTSISGGAFAYCRRLTEITIPNSVTSISGGAFNNCDSLTSITIPASVTSIGTNPFEYCSNLVEIIVEDGNPVYDSRDNCNAIIKTASNSLISGCKGTTIPTSVTSIGQYAFNGCKGLTSITIPNSVTSISGGAFNYCNSLTSITIPTSVTSIGSQAFSYCTSLTSVTFADIEGWTAFDDILYDDSIEFLSTDLADPETAATYLVSTYYFYAWTRVEAPTE